MEPECWYWSPNECSVNPSCSNLRQLHCIASSLSMDYYSFERKKSRNVTYHSFMKHQDCCVLEHPLETDTFEKSDVTDSHESCSYLEMSGFFKNAESNYCLTGFLIATSTLLKSLLSIDFSCSWCLSSNALHSIFGREASLILLIPSTAVHFRSLIFILKNSSS